jgi:hypothetical protein
MVETGAIGIIVGKHDIATGVVDFYGDKLILNNPE